MYEYKCKIRRVVDGDTVDVDIDLGFDTWLHNKRIRLSGIDAYESRTRDLEEKKKGKAATKFVEDFVEPEMVLRTTEYNARGKFGRILGELYNSKGECLNKLLIEHNHAVPYLD